MTLLEVIMRTMKFKWSSLWCHKIISLSPVPIASLMYHILDMSYTMIYFPSIYLWTPSRFVSVQDVIFYGVISSYTDSVISPWTRIITSQVGCTRYALGPWKHGGDIILYGNSWFKIEIDNIWNKPSWEWNDTAGKLLWYHIFVLLIRSHITWNHAVQELLFIRVYWIHQCHIWALL